MSHCVLIVEQDPAKRLETEQLIKKFGFAARAVGDVRYALPEQLSQFGENICAVLLSLNSRADDGIAFIEKLRESPGAPPVIVQIDRSQIELASRALNAGATDFITVPTVPDRLRVVLRNAARLHALEDELSRFRPHLQAAISFDDIIGESPEIKRAVELGRRATWLKMPVLLEGEPGVGKAFLARAIHNESERAGKPFLRVDCAELACDGAANTLFAEGGGIYWKAEGGSLFLDEIGALPKDAQAKLLSVLEEMPVIFKADQPLVQPKVGIFAASSRDMIALVKAGEFREDLFYRLNVFPIWMPPLRERGNDIISLAVHFMERFAAGEHKHLGGIEDEAMRLLLRYQWPGNVRELQNAMFRAVILAEGDRLTISEFPQIAAQVEGFPVQAAPRPGGQSPAPRYPGRPILGAHASSPKPRALAATPASGVVGIPALTEHGDIRSLEDIEADLIRLALGRYRGRMTEVAKRLGIGRSTLYRKMREFGLGVRPGARH